MNDETPDWLDELLRDAARTYNRPPPRGRIPLHAMWRQIDREAFGVRRRTTRGVYWLGIAAALIVGVGIGRLSLADTHSQKTANVASSPGVARVDSTAQRASSSEPLDPVTSKYLGQAAALLIALPSEASGRPPDRPFIRRANELLLTTRLLLDSRASQDPSLRNLLEDLELVLVQVVQLDKDRDHVRQTELDLIQQALEQRDVIPRLRTAASEYAAD
jgi:hypothetical protein